MKKRIINYFLLVSLIFINAKCFSPQIGGDGNLSVVGKYNIDMAYGFDIKNDNVYLGTNDGLLILDISNCQKPVKVAELELGFIREVKVIDGMAYLSGGVNGLIIVDVSDVKQPKLIGKYRDTGEIYGFAKSGSYGYLCDRLEGLKVIDIKDPRNPQKISNWSNGGQYWEIEIKDKIAYVADSRDGLEIIDISDPTSVKLINTISGTKGASSVQISEKNICIGSFDGINVLDIENPRVPNLIISTLKNQEVLQGCISKNLLFAGAKGITVFDVTKPDEPEQLANWTITGGVHKIIYEGSYIYTAKKGFYILKLNK